MKHFLSYIAIFIFITSNLFSEITKKTITIDNLYKIERTYDDSTGILDLNLISDNSAPFDEQYAEDSITEALNDFLDDYELDSECFELRSSTLNNSYNSGKSTSLDKKYSIKK